MPGTLRDDVAPRNSLWYTSARSCAMKESALFVKFTGTHAGAAATVRWEEDAVVGSVLHPYVIRQVIKEQLAAGPAAMTVEAEEAEDDTKPGKAQAGSDTEVEDVPLLSVWKPGRSGRPLWVPRSTQLPSAKRRKGQAQAPIRVKQYATDDGFHKPPLTVRLVPANAVKALSLRTMSTC